MKCRLCLQEKPLIKQSHILSNFLYDNILEDEGSMLVVSQKMLRDPDAKPKPAFTGEFEGGLLCADCDNRLLGENEAYASYVLFGKKSGNFSKPDYHRQVHPDGKLISIYVEKLDYRKFKLFLLGLLWRASISSRDYFKNVKLGPYEERIRRMLLEGDPGSAKDFPVIVNFFPKKNSAAAKTAAQPFVNKKKGYIYYFHIGQLFLMYFVSPNSVPEYISELAISESGTMRVIESDGYLEEILLEKEFGTGMGKKMLQLWDDSPNLQT